MKETFRNIYSVLMGILTILAVTAVLGLSLGIRPKILTTDSMFPSIYRGSLVLVNENADWESLNAGDVIVFRSGATEVMHRVTEISDAGLILKPDNGRGESLVTREMYVGKEILAFPFVGEIIKPILQRGKGGVILLAVGLILIGCYSGRKKTEIS